MQLPAIRPMTAADVDPVADAILQSGWGDRRIKMAWVAGHPACRAFVADADGAIVGTGVATINGPVGWIGTIWVDPKWRGRGLGKGLTSTTIEAAEAAGCQALVLVATQAGQPLYERFGFEVQARYRTLEARGLAGPGVADRRIRPFADGDLPAMTALDAAATGEDRSHVLADLAAPGTARCLARADGSLGGYVVRAPWGGGATIAPDPDDALAILHARRLAAGPDKRVRAGLIDSNRVGLERLLAAGWVEAWQAPRMIRGRMPPWQPAAIWGQFDHAIG
jgi:predicted N-acetyltransferase YhbS